MVGPKGYTFWKSYLLTVGFAKFCVVFKNFVLERAPKLYLLRGKIVASLLT